MAAFDIVTMSDLFRRNYIEQILEIKMTPMCVLSLEAKS